MKVYLDNGIVSAIVMDDNATESAALYRLLAAYGDGEVDLVTSTVTLKEIERYQGPQRPAIKQIFRLLKEVPNACIPMIRNDGLYDDLLKRGLEDIDAWHVFVAVKNGCHAFLTCDRLIHHYAAAIRWPGRAEAFRLHVKPRVAPRVCNRMTTLSAFLPSK